MYLLVLYSSRQYTKIDTSATTFNHKRLCLRDMNPKQQQFYSLVKSVDADRRDGPIGKLITSDLEWNLIRLTNQ